MLLDCIRKSKNLFLWPYEFHYFKLFNQASQNKKENKIFILNNYFLEHNKLQYWVS